MSILLNSVTRNAFMRPIRLSFLCVAVLGVSGCSFNAPWSGGLNLWPFGKGRVEAQSEVAERIGQGEEGADSQTYYDELSRTTGAVIEKEPQGMPEGMRDVPLEQPHDLILTREATELPENVTGLNDDVMAEDSPEFEGQAQMPIDLTQAEMADIERDIALVSEELAALQPAYARIAELENKMMVLFTRLEDLILEQNELQQRQLRMQASRPMVAPTTRQTPSKAGGVSASAQQAGSDLFEYNAQGQSLPEGLAHNVVKMRHGQHSDKLRLVLEVEGVPEYKISLNEAEQLLVIELPQTSWSLAESGAFSKTTPVLESWIVQSLEQEQGVRVVIALSSQASIKSEDLIRAENGRPSRLFIDLYAPAIHGS